MGNSKKSKVVKEVLSRLERHDRPVRSKRTLVLTTDIYDRFEKLCRAQNRYPSEVVDEFIKLFVESEG